MKQKITSKPAEKPSASNSVISNREWTKIVALGTVTLLFHIVFWILFRGVLSHGVTLTSVSGFLGAVVPTFVALFFSLALVGIAGYLIPKRSVMLGLSGILALLPLAFFPFHIASLAAAAFLFVGFSQYDLRLKYELNLRLKFSVAGTVRHGLGAATLCLLAAASLVFYGYTNESRPAGQSALVPFSDSVGNAANQVLLLQVKDYNPRETVDDFLFRMVADLEKKGTAKTMESSGIDLKNPASILEQIQAQGLGDFVGSLPPDVQEQLKQNPDALKAQLAAGTEDALKAQLNALRDEIFKGLKVAATGATPIGDVIQDIVSREVEKALKPYERYLPPLISVAIFLILTIGSVVYIVLTEALIVLLMTILKSAKFFRIAEVDAKKQFVTLT